MGSFENEGIRKIVGTVDPLHWTRKGLWIEVQNGDLFEEKNGSPVLQWSGLALVAPFHVKPPPSDAILPTTTGHASARSEQRLTTVQASINQAVKALWPDGIPKALPVQTRDQMIIKWQRNHQLAVASSKSIYRHLKKMN